MVGGEEVLAELLAEGVEVALAQAHAQAAADHDGLDVEHVARRGHADPEGDDRAVHQVLGHLVALVERALHTPLVSRVRLRFSMILKSSVFSPWSKCSLRARASIIARPA